MAINIVAKAALQQFWRVHLADQGPLEKWYQAVRHATWERAEDVRKTYNSIDKVGEFTVFDVGHRVRIVVDIAFSQKRLYIKHVFTHAEYDKWTEAQRKVLKKH